MKKKIALALAYLFFLSILPPLSYVHATDVKVKGSNVYLGDNNALGTLKEVFDGSYNRTPKVADLITKGPWVSPRAFNAVGDGVADDTSAVDNTVTYLRTFGQAAKAPALMIDGRFKVTSSINMRDMFGLKIISLTNWSDSNYIKGVNIAGPVLDLGGTMASMTNVSIISDNCYSAVWFYRTVTHLWGGPQSLTDCFFYGTATKATIYSVAAEEVNIVGGNYGNGSNAPVFESAPLDVQNIISASNLSVNSRYGGSSESNTMIFVNGGRWVGYGGNASGSVFRLRGGSSYYFSNLSTPGMLGYAPVFDIGGDGYTVSNISITNVRYESALSPTAGYAFIRLREGINNLTVVGCEINDPKMFTMDNTATVPLTRSFIAGNHDVSTGVTSVNYTFKDIASTYMYAPFANVIVTGDDSGNEITARSITYTGSGGISTRSIGSRNSVIPATSSTMSKVSEVFQPQTADIDATYHIAGRFTLPDGATWSPKGLKNKPAMMLDRGDGEIHWFQFPVVGGGYPVNTVPASNSVYGTVGQFTWNTTHLYVAIADNTWKRVAWDNTW